VIGHEAESQQVDGGGSFLCFAEQFDKGLIIAGFVEDFHPAVAAIDDVIEGSRFDRSCCSWHENGYYRTAQEKQTIMNDPFPTF
jgi:hypothetical protein